MVDNTEWFEDTEIMELQKAEIIFLAISTENVNDEASVS